MFYADKLYWGNLDGDDSSAGNYTLDYDNSFCTPHTIVGRDTNISSVILDLAWNNGTADTVKMRFDQNNFVVCFENKKIRFFSLIANITGRYWYLEKAIINNTEYRYFAYGMHSKMDTPPTFSYVCTTAVFVKYDPKPPYGSYDFQDKFYITSLQVK
jgi:hypothetical protein